MANCPGADGLDCIDGWLYSSHPVNMMIFPANRKCPVCNKDKEVMSLNNFTSKTEVDVWEVDYFDTDWEGRKLAGPLLGVRVNGGVWLEVSALMKFIEERKTEL